MCVFILPSECVFVGLHWNSDGKTTVKRQWSEWQAHTYHTHMQGLKWPLDGHKICKQILHFPLLTSFPLPPFQHHFDKGQVVCRPRDPLYAEGPGPGSRNLQHWTHVGHRQACQGVGLRGSASAACLLSDCDSHRGFWRILHLRWREWMGKSPLGCVLALSRVFPVEVLKTTAYAENKYRFISLT